ncbi:Serpentine Receptor, class E (Epsilon) [Caenorhabditis elegans]|uniref:Serpentine Receptor, class E (Epsilon) n=1 Tax=Caenorhabditis elegans TaxID=6239 RepID=Q7YTN8_CAEEL|nr:Serpentine Receptor, class E (Epsilon) [Caenorhabditis elegans]CAE17792.1 Serpentine Receptor, class E (Epsilon) [Caenorhabditis elegans]|eukprot:NP_001023794.1 Serpentine Receptor, class E (epsilon) [Caenorhabditis elegans]
MNLLLWNSVDIWVPSYVFNDDSFLTWWNIPYFLFIFFSMVTCSWLSFYMTIVMWKVKKFHGNATYILSCMYISWFECLLGTLVILPYKYGIINLAEPDQTFEGFEDTSNYLKIDSLSWKCVPLLIATFMEWHYVGIVNSSFSCFLIERTFATVLFSDYESIYRKKLSIFLIIYHQAYAIFLALVMLFHVFPLRNLLGMNACGLLFVIPHLFFLRYYNLKARNNMRLARNITKNSLAAKFQTEENLRSISLAFRIYIIMIIFDIVFLINIYLGILKVSGAKYYSQAAEHIIFFGPLFLVPAIVSSVQDWRKQFLFYIPINRVQPEESKYELAATPEQSAAIHFKQLQNLWV